ncbi:hypothetical protein VL4N_13700 [Vagococcus lutrae]|uniref:helix-turn-helix domain-containing protein n=1 Tax=Vagococcus lutrae TaxID=81947 RepID=UPI0019267714|nr:hypothetical protein VL2N_13600 [Vagococcus lutrae]GEQ63929.1 hypothetical protein VL3N_13710 [Vagococcus lutrae]GEQ65820.1 hypothetical protein VL4N_13700 [Vagococcus lutrae]
MDKNTELKVFIARRIHYYRQKFSYSQENLSKLANLESEYINKIENLKYNTKIGTLDKIIKSLDMYF